MHNLIGQLFSASVHTRFFGVQSLQPEASNTSGSNTPAPVESVAPPEDTQTQNAVTAAEDPVEIDPTAQAFGDLQSIINAINNAHDGDMIKGALTALKSFVSDNTNSAFAGDVLDKLSDMADKVFDKLDEDPNAFGNFYAFHLDVNFKQRTTSNDDFYKNSVKLNVSFSFESENTSMHADMGFREVTKQQGDVSRYRSNEYATISVTSKNMSLDDNPAIGAFSDITNMLAGKTAASLANFGKSNPVPQLYAPIDVLQILKDSLSKVKDSLDQLEKLLEAMKDAIKPTTGDTPAVEAPAVEAPAETAAAAA